MRDYDLRKYSTKLKKCNSMSIVFGHLISHTYVPCEHPIIDLVFVVIRPSTLEGRLPNGFYSMAIGIGAHSFTRALVRLSADEKAWHQVGLRSGVCTDHLISATSPLANYVFMTMPLCHVAQVWTT